MAHLLGVLGFAACGGGEKFIGDGDPAACACSYDAIRQPWGQHVRPLTNSRMCSANCAGNVGYGAAQQINGLLLFHKAHISTLSNNEASTVSVPTKISLARLTINVSRLTVTPIAAKRSDGARRSSQPDRIVNN